MKKVLKAIAIFFGCIFLIGGCMSAMGNNDSSSSSSSSSVSTSSSSSSSSSAKKAEAPKEEKKLTLQQEGLKDQSVSVEYRNALKKAISYAEKMHMSKAKVYHQLTSDYGEKFPEEAANWAVSHLSDIDWNKNALAKAKEYEKNMSMSRDRIQHQLVSEYGEQFTEEEAAYAMQHIDD